MIESPGQPRPDDPSGASAAATAPPAASRAGRPLRIALAHDWLCGYRGGEAVLERIALMLSAQPDVQVAALYTMFDDWRAMAPAIDALQAQGLVRTTRLGSSALGLRARRWLLPLYPRLVRQLSRQLAADHALNPFDLLISTSSAAIKGIFPPPGVPHLCYCHSPARYIWSQRSQYTGGPLGAVRAAALAAYSRRFKAWDRATAATVTRFLANSSHTAREISRCFGRSATVVFPPVRTGFFTPDPTVWREPFWLLVSALEPYKRIDLAIAAAARAGVELVIAGQGSERRRLERLAKWHGLPARGAQQTRATQAPAEPNNFHVRFLGRVSDEDLRALYRRARLLLFPQVEDFGIVAAEALACGTPILARRAGGALDIVDEGVTGAFFDEPTPEAIVEASRRVPQSSDAACRAAAERFSESRFDAGILQHLQDPSIRARERWP